MKKKFKSEDRIKKMQEMLGLGSNFKNKKSKTNFTMAEVYFLVFVSVVFSLMGGMILAKVIDNEPTVKKQTESKYSEEIEAFIENFEFIKEKYYGEFDESVVLDEALDGAIKSLGDPYSIFMNQTESDEFNFALDGSFTGLGIELLQNPEENKIEVVGIVENSPASKVGLEEGDLIISMNSISTENKTGTEFVKMVRDSGNTLDLIIERNGKELEYSITKGLVELQSVYSEVLEDGIGYIDINIFAKNTATQFATQLSYLRGQGIKSLIIDVRGNTGGHLFVVEDILMRLLDSSMIMYQTESKNGITKIYSKGTKETDLKIVLLADGASASASEILIGALTENLNATFVGTTTFGKGTVQELKTLPNGSQYKVTVEKWLTPNGNWINENGIKPDIELVIDEAYFTEQTFENDNQLQKALEEIKK